MQRQTPPRHVPRDVLLWRRRVLLDAGCDPTLARALAADGEIDSTSCLASSTAAVRRAWRRGSSARSEEQIVAWGERLRGMGEGLHGERRPHEQR
jgi:hypothetical protein